MQSRHAHRLSAHAVSVSDRESRQAIPFFRCAIAGKNALGQNLTPYRLNDESDIRANDGTRLAKVGVICDGHSGNVLLSFNARCRWILMSWRAGEICSEDSRMVGIS
jgi:hypothetical protein